ncbi:MAG: 3-oxoacyl-[acyl-carrier-protein] synthase III C-terminal domain-containing protein [Planctomycetota bacterium]
MSLALRARRGVRLVATAQAHPTELPPLGRRGERLTNAAVYGRLFGDRWEAELERRGWSPDHVQSQWGVAEREWVVEADAGDLAILAARRAREAAPAVSPEVVVVATSTPARISSALASRVARELDLSGPAVDVRAGGVGALQAWITALGWLEAGARSALVVASEVPSAYVDPADLGSSLLYGDGAGAVLLEAGAHDEGLLGGVFGNDAAPGRPFTIPGDLPPTAAACEAGVFRFQPPSKDYVDAIHGRWRRLASDLRERFDAVLARGAQVVPYAVTRPQLDLVTKALDVDPARVHSQLERQGCQGCAGPLVALHRLREARGDVPVLLLAVGGGVAWGALGWGPVMP